MKILSITAGAANMYCGSCLRDNALAAELLRRGHDVTLMPVYTPTVTDEPNVSAGNPVLFGGISVYLEQHVPLFRHTPRLLDRLWDAAPVIKAFAGRSMKTDPGMLGEMTVSMLKGEDGHQKKEFEKLIEWLAQEPPPDIVNIPNSLLISMAGPIRRTLSRPVVVTPWLHSRKRSPTCSCWTSTCRTSPAGRCSDGSRRPIASGYRSSSFPPPHSPPVG